MIDVTTEVTRINGLATAAEVEVAMAELLIRLEDERDHFAQSMMVSHGKVKELRRRLDAVVAMLDPGEEPKNLYSKEHSTWYHKSTYHAAAVGIAKGGVS